jgi:hypothetical protein
MTDQTIAERIIALRAEARAFLDTKAAELAQETPGVPVSVLRNLIAAPTPGCLCQQVLREEGVE